MLAPKNRLIFGVVKRIVLSVFKAVYQVIKAFNLQITIFILLLGLVLYVVGALKQGSALLIVFCILTVFSVLYAVIITLKKLLGFKGKRKTSVKIVGPKEIPVPEIKNDDDIQKQQTAYVSEKPTYYAVKNNPGYVMAEYSDRYELFIKSRDGLKKIRTDYK